jgi:shikimate kinase
VGARPERIVLIGLRRAGKTTAGGLLAQSLRWRLIDTDDVVAKMTGRTPADWIRGPGLEAFREAESSAVASIGALRQVVIATGGGVPLADKNRKILRESALIAYLRADPSVLAGRARTDSNAALRPPLATGTPDEEPFILFAERDAAYRTFSDLVVDASRPPAAIVASILDHLAQNL